MFLSSTDKLSNTLVTLQTNLPVLQQRFSSRVTSFLLHLPRIERLMACIQQLTFKNMMGYVG
jgi:hypothetical protein